MGLFRRDIDPLIEPEMGGLWIILGICLFAFLLVGFLHWLGVIQ